MFTRFDNFLQYLTYFSFWQLQLIFLVSVLGATRSSLTAAAISLECEQFCDDKRPQGTTEEFKAFCGISNPEYVKNKVCLGDCKAHGCDDDFCIDGMSVSCPSKLPRDLSVRQFSDYPYRHDDRKRDSDSKPQKPVDLTILIAVVVGILVLVILITAGGVYYYIVYIQKRRQQNLNRYQLQAPSPGYQNPAPTPPSQSPAGSSLRKVSIAAHYLPADGNEVQAI